MGLEEVPGIFTLLALSQQYVSLHISTPPSLSPLFHRITLPRIDLENLGSPTMPPADCRQERKKPSLFVLESGGGGGGGGGGSFASVLASPSPVKIRRGSNSRGEERGHCDKGSGASRRTLWKEKWGAPLVKIRFQREGKWGQEVGTGECTGGIAGRTVEKGEEE